MENYIIVINAIFFRKLFNLDLSYLKEIGSNLLFFFSVPGLRAPPLFALLPPLHHVTPPSPPGMDRLLFPWLPLPFDLFLLLLRLCWLSSSSPTTTERLSTCQCQCQCVVNRTCWALLLPGVSSGHSSLLWSQWTHVCVCVCGTTRPLPSAFVPVFICISVCLRKFTLWCECKCFTSADRRPD